ncbi:MAG TPA: hypothetical protein VFQ54_02860 [Thermomicrobiales bacterium]|nr:hypothetical protein [Thermomicrobiales bacterium]
MGYPEITEDQREMVVEMLANAIRKDAHLRARADRPLPDGTPLRANLMRRRAEPSQRYIDGMRDLVRVLFVDGQTLATACLEDAYRRAMGISAPVANDGDAPQAD